MNVSTPRLHRVLFAVILLGNAVAFAGVDPVTRAVTAALVLVLALEMRQVPELPQTARAAIVTFAILVLVQLVPLPAVIRRLIEPGLAPFSAHGWFSLSVAPSATLQAAATIAIAVIVGVAAARMTGTRTGVPFILTTLAATGGLLALLGLATEQGLPAKVLLVRANTGGGSPYGPFVNHNHFALAVELTVPAALALLAAAARRLRLPGEGRRQAAVIFLGASATAVLELAALVRCGSRGGVLFLVIAGLGTLALWRRRHRGLRWPWAVLASVLIAGVVILAFNRIQPLHDRFEELFILQGVEGNTRLDLWSGTLRLWERSPAAGCGLGAYEHAIGLDKPPTGSLYLEQAHNDWLELLADGGVVGFGALLVLVAGLAGILRPSRTRSLRFELRYPAAAAAMALAACGLHELAGFGLQSPLNGLLASTWVGLLWGLDQRRRTRRAGPGEADEKESPDAS